ncbi:tyrosine-type recombinase/integrase [Flavobacterium sp. CSZ]|uniref:tyrosine-type recombinase/integrase n=1 Tax=Flavobacterium sp. CSZ TaxID=2783791 RepID=UPI00188D3933|nr:tyrosine-type recombinase/integrase [Flavobacterium sp. CSZ]MBF4485595.1 tyrosine-type recombinase/integrase [Flavobacterium sp. CSZ]
MIKLKLPSNSHKGIKIYCNDCKRDNPKCNHFSSQKFKVRIHVTGTLNNKVTKVLIARTYNEAVKEAIDFENEVKRNNFQKAEILPPVQNDYSIADAVIRYNQYLSGDYEFAQYVKTVSDAHRKECIRFCKYFCQSFKGVKDISNSRIDEVNKIDVARFYKWAESHFPGEKTFNKCMSGLKAFFKFLIDIEEIQMKNPFAVYSAKHVQKKNIYSLTKGEFDAILDAVDTFDPKTKLGGKGESKNMYRPYLKNGFKLFLFTGGRREEVVDLKWSDIEIRMDGTKFFRISNLKVERQRKKECFRYVPINADLNDLLIELGYSEKKYTNNYILFPERTVMTKTIMNDMSKAFSHYKKGVEIEKDVSLKSLRKTYISWVNHVMDKNTGLLSSHSTYDVLERHYIDPTVMTAIEKGALEIKIFG